jgi:hypothetical protein
VSVISSIAVPAKSRARSFVAWCCFVSARFGRPLDFTVSPNSTRRRMASARLRFPRHASNPAMNSSDRRNVRAGSRPVGFRPEPGRGPPCFFGIAFSMSQFAWTTRCDRDRCQAPVRFCLGTGSEQPATILLPNSVGQYGIGWHPRGVSSEKLPIGRDILKQNKTGRHGHKRISSAVHSTTLPPLQTPGRSHSVSMLRGRGEF